MQTISFEGWKHRVIAIANKRFQLGLEENSFPYEDLYNLYNSNYGAQEAAIQLINKYV